MAGPGKERRRGRTHTQTLARPKEQLDIQRSAPRSKCASSVPSPHTPKALVGDGRQYRRAQKRGGEREVMSECVCPSVCGRPVCAPAPRSVSVERPLRIGLCVCLSVGPSGSLCRFLPRRGVCTWFTMFLVSLGVAVYHFAVYLLVTTSVRADGASGGRETDGDAWAATAPCRPHSRRHSSSRAHAHTRRPPLHVAE